MKLTKRFWDQVFINEWEPNACWEWQGQLSDGYGRYGRPKQPSHRLSFLEFGGILTIEKPDVLHKCNNKACVRPNHLYSGDQSDNNFDMVKAGTHPGAKKTHCKNGHEFNTKNTRYRKGRGGRICRICMNAIYRIKHKNKVN